MILHGKLAALLYFFAPDFFPGSEKSTWKPKADQIDDWGQGGEVPRKRDMVFYHWVDETISYPRILLAICCSLLCILRARLPHAHSIFAEPHRQACPMTRAMIQMLNSLV